MLLALWIHERVLNAPVLFLPYLLQLSKNSSFLPQL